MTCLDPIGLTYSQSSQSLGTTEKVNLLRCAPENRSSSRVVTREWLLKNYKLSTRCKNETSTNLRIKKTIKETKMQIDQTTNTTQKSSTHVFKILNTICGENSEILWFQVSL
jgi:hypothetical protein